MSDQRAKINGYVYAAKTLGNKDERSLCVRAESFIGTAATFWIEIDHSHNFFIEWIGCSALRAPTIRRNR